MDLDLVALVALALVLFAGSAAAVAARRRGRRRDTEAWERNVARGLHVAQSLHPIIDTDVCIGSLSCIKACPEGDILGVVNGAARLVHAANCIGHGRCAAECPVEAIRLVFGSSERGVDLPEVDEFFESIRPGVHVVGELGGMGLIRNAVTQGLQVAARLDRILAMAAAAKVGREIRVAHDGGVALPVLEATDAPDGEAVDVCVVGAGPAGLATAAALRKTGRTVRVIEQGTLGGTVSQYPRHKVVMTDPLELPYAGRISRRHVSKEELIAFFGKLLERSGLVIDEGIKVIGIDGEDGAFRVHTTASSIHARKVVLACGRRGTPRRIGCAGENLPKVTYRLLDPEQYIGARVLVVGGGDSALEAANALADAGVEVTISYRGPEFGRCRPANKEGLEGRAAAGRIRTAMATEVERIEAGQVILRTPNGNEVLRNDYVIVLIGGELPLEFLKTVGVGVKRLHGEVLQRSRQPDTRKTGPSKAERETRSRRRFAILLAASGLAIVAFLAWYGRGYYLLDEAARRSAGELHRLFRPAGPWGHGVGIAATAFMLSNFLYAVRKRWGRLKRAGTIWSWLTFHMFVGFMSPVVIAFHAAFQSNNGLATATAAALAIVVSTGIIGRFIYGLVPVSGGRTLELADLLGRWERERERLHAHGVASANRAAVDELVARTTATPAGGSLPALFARLPGETLGLRLRLAALRSHFDDPDAYRDFRGELLALVHLRRQVGFYRGLKHLLSGWRLFHASLAVFLILVIAAHIGVSLYLGYGWTLG